MSTTTTQCLNINQPHIYAKQSTKHTHPCQQIKSYVCNYFLNLSLFCPRSILILSSACPQPVLSLYSACTQPILSLYSEYPQTVLKLTDSLADNLLGWNKIFEFCITTVRNILCVFADPLGDSRFSSICEYFLSISIVLVRQ